MPWKTVVGSQGIVNRAYLALLLNGELLQAWANLNKYDCKLNT